METGSQSWPRRLRSHGSVACLMALLITAGCASAPDSSREALNDSYTEATVSGDSAQKAYTPSLTQVAYRPSIGTQVAYVPDTSDVPLVRWFLEAHSVAESNGQPSDEPPIGVDRKEVQ